MASALDGTKFTVNKMVEVELLAGPPPLWSVTSLYDVRGDALTLRRGNTFGGHMFMADGPGQSDA